MTVLILIKAYKVYFFASKIIGDELYTLSIFHLPDNLKIFEFNLNVILVDFQISSLQPYSAPKHLRLTLYFFQQV